MRRLSSPVFVGRAAELDVLHSAWAAALRGLPGSIVVGGEAGVGKSRLISEFARHVRESDGRVLIGACSDFGEGGLPFGAITEAVRPLARELPPTRLSELVGPAGSELARLVPELAADDALPLPAPSDGFARARLFELLLGFLDRIARDRPTLLVLEDLHWADVSTRDFLAFLARNLHDERMLVVGTFRTDEVHRRHPLRPYLAELERSGTIDRLQLAPFDLPELRAQAEAILGEDPGPDLIERVFRQSEGNPFFTEELLAAGGGHVDDVPATLQAILAARFEALPGPAQHIVRIAAVGGRRVDERLLDNVAGLPQDQFVDAMREAVAHGVLLPVSNFIRQGYEFRHALFQKAIYADLLPGERRGLHRSLAEALTTMQTSAMAGDAEIAAQLAHHWYHAQDPRQALAASVEAGAAAERTFAFAEALMHFDRALELWSAVDDPTNLTGMDRLSLVSNAARVARAAGNTPRAAALLRSAIDKTDAAREPLRLGVLHGDLMISLLEAGDDRGADEAIETALRLTSVQPGTTERAHVLMLAGIRVAMTSRYRDALPLLFEARELALAVGATEERIPSPSRLTLTLGSLVPVALCIAYLGDVDKAIRLLLEERRASNERQAIYEVVDSYIPHALVLEAACRFDDAIALVQEALATVRTFALERAVAADLHGTAAEALRHLGRWAEADVISAEAARDLVRRDGTGWHFGGAHAARGLLLVGMGRLEEADKALDAARDAFPHGTEPASVGFNGQYFSARAEAALQRSEPGRAREHVAVGLGRVELSADMRWIGHLSALGMRAEADRAEMARSRRDEAQISNARDVGERLLAGLRAGVTKCLEEGTIFRREAPGHLALAEAEFARMSGRSEPALWSSAARTWEELREPYPVAYALYRQAETTLRSSRSRTEPTRLLQEARAITQRLGAEPLRAEIEGLAKRARLNLASDQETTRTQADKRRPAAALDAYGLTPREHEVLAMLATGRSDREIADALYISGKTASVHVSNIKGKLGVNNRVEAATVAVRLGLSNSIDDSR